MDRFASNTLRTLGIVFTSIFVIVCCLALLLLALCAGILGGVGGSGHHDPQTVNLFYGAILVAILIVTLGVLVIARLAKGIVHEPAGIGAPVWGQPPSTVPWSNAPPPEPPNPDQPDSAQPDFAQRDLSQPATAPPPTPIQPTTPQPRPSHDVVTHLSPASRAAIQRLVTAIAAQVVLGTLGWQWAFHATATPFHPNRLIPYVSGFASNLPYLVLLLSLLRQPGRRAFAYALTIPSLLLLSGIFSSSAIIFYLIRTAHASMSFLSFLLLIPWALHILILYLAWKAIRLTGIFPNPARLIAAAAVTFVYYALLPVALAYLTYRLH
ncbi:MAG TPA: hypothetical protein VKR60_15390 [Candidatus Sulfotelmatobacter sp.]|nr:hypothetical protein [Candidatus Sulfotelmatobacter sp.]